MYILVEAIPTAIQGAVGKMVTIKKDIKLKSISEGHWIRIGEDIYKVLTLAHEENGDCRVICSKLGNVESSNLYNEDVLPNEPTMKSIS
jgi:hypothetical protein